jgi:hypothetical protein
MTEKWKISYFTVDPRLPMFYPLHCFGMSLPTEVPFVENSYGNDSELVASTQASYAFFTS